MILKVISGIFLLFLLSQNVYSYNVSITDKAVDANLHGEYNRGSVYEGSFSATGEAELNNFLLLKAGLSFGISGETASIKTFTSANTNIFANIPIIFSVSWIYSGLLEYSAHTHTFLPVITYGSSIAGISIGVNFRLTSFLSEPAISEQILSFLIYLNFINSELLRIGTSIGNFDDFSAKNLGAASLSFFTDFRINENWHIISKIEFMQSGIFGLSANFYGFAWKGGVRYSW